MNKQKMQEVKDKVADTIWHLKLIAKVIFYQIVILLVAMGILYATNFRVEIKPNVQVISPVVEVK